MQRMDQPPVLPNLAGKDFYRNNQNRTYVTYILESLSAYPQIKPLFLVLKKLCETFGLHDH
jgi:hypothetical protein